MVGAEVVGTAPYRLARPPTASVYENTPSSVIWYMTGIYQVYTTYWALGPDPNRRGTDLKNRPEADVSIAFIGLVPGLNTNGTFKHQRH